MGITVSTSGETGKFDIFDSGLGLLALHSACLALAFTASSQPEIVRTFNVVLMIAGFACGAVLAVVAAYYGAINAKALAPQLIGEHSAEATVLQTESASGEKTTKVSVVVGSAPGDTDLRLDPVSPRRGVLGKLRTANRSRWIAAGAAFLVLVVTTILVWPTPPDVDVVPPPAAEALAAAGPLKPARPMAAGSGVSTPVEKPRAADTRATAVVTPEKADKREAEAKKKRGAAAAALDEAKAERAKVERGKWIRAFLIIGLAALVLLPIPIAWTGPSPVLSATRGFLVLGSLLCFVLGTGSGLLPLAAQAVEKGIENAREEPGALPGEPGAPERLPAPVNITFNGPTPGLGTGGIGTIGQGAANGGSPNDRPTGDAVQIASLEQRIGELQGAFANAAAAREVSVILTDPRPAPIINPAEVRIIQPQILPPPSAGEKGREGPMLSCKFAWNPPSFRICSRVPAPPEDGVLIPLS